jgi:hypothetical protein
MHFAKVTGSPLSRGRPEGFSPRHFAGRALSRGIPAGLGANGSLASLRFSSNRRDCLRRILGLFEGLRMPPRNRSALSSRRCRDESQNELRKTPRSPTARADTGREGDVSALPRRRRHQRARPAQGLRPLQGHRKNQRSLLIGRFDLLSAFSEMSEPTRARRPRRRMLPPVSIRLPRNIANPGVAKRRTGGDINGLARKLLSRLFEGVLKPWCHAGR